MENGSRSENPFTNEMDMPETERIVAWANDATKRQEWKKETEKPLVNMQNRLTKFASGKSASKTVQKKESISRIDIRSTPLALFGQSNRRGDTNA